MFHLVGDLGRRVSTAIRLKPIIRTLRTRQCSLSAGAVSCTVQYGVRQRFRAIAIVLSADQRDRQSPRSAVHFARYSTGPRPREPGFPRISPSRQIDGFSPERLRRGCLDHWARLLFLLVLDTTCKWPVSIPAERHVPPFPPVNP
jgi:hypothetical protein